MNKFIQKHVIPCYQTDANWRLKPASFMDLAQEAANSHAAILGFGYDDLIQSRTAWILSRVNIHFIKAPLWRDEVTLTTWHKGLTKTAMNVLRLHHRGLSLTLTPEGLSATLI